MPALLLSQKRVCARKADLRESLIGDLIDKMQVDTRLLSNLIVVLKVKSGLELISSPNRGLQARGLSRVMLSTVSQGYEDFHAVIGREVGRP